MSKDAGERTTCPVDLGCRGFGIFRPLMRRYVAQRYISNIGAASIYVVKFLAEPLPGGKPK
jgi:hypothetical protein